MKPKTPWIIGGGCLVLGVIFLVCCVMLVIRATSRPTMSKRQAADILMSALQAGDYAKAFEVLGPHDGAGRDFGSDASKFQNWIETNSFQVKSWTWTNEKEVTSSNNRTGVNRTSWSGYTLYGTVLFTDGTRGTVELKMNALGLQYNPWRFQGIRLKREPGQT
jgi:hypothetical protein